MSRIEKMKNIAEKLSALNAEADKATSAIEEFNHFMEGCGLGIEVWQDASFGWDSVTADEMRAACGHAVTGTISRYLGYAKVTDKWQLAVLTTYEDEQRAEIAQVVTALRSCDRNVRCDAYLRIDDFLKDIEKEVDSRTAKLRAKF